MQIHRILRPKSIVLMFSGLLIFSSNLCWPIEQIKEEILNDGVKKYYYNQEDSQKPNFFIIFFGKIFYFF